MEEKTLMQAERWGRALVATVPLLLLLAGHPKTALGFLGGGLVSVMGFAHLSRNISLNSYARFLFHFLWRMTASAFVLAGTLALGGSPLAVAFGLSLMVGTISTAGVLKATRTTCKTTT